jgi:hypothetical protein
MFEFDSNNISVSDTKINNKIHFSFFNENGKYQDDKGNVRWMFGTEVEPVDISWEELIAHYMEIGHEIVEEKNATPMFNMSRYSIKGKKKKNVESVSGLVLDFDNPEAFSIDEFINFYKHTEFFLYSTFSHKSNPDHNYCEQYRVVIPFLDEMPVDMMLPPEKLTPEQQSIIPALLEEYPGLDPKSYTISQSFFIPSCREEHKDMAVMYHNRGRVMDWRSYKPVPGVKVPRTTPQIEHTGIVGGEGALIYDTFDIYRYFDENGLIIHSNGDGSYDVHCPFESEHTGGDESGAVIWTEPPSFTCQHSHGGETGPGLRTANRIWLTKRLGDEEIRPYCETFLNKREQHKKRVKELREKTKTKNQRVNSHFDSEEKTKPNPEQQTGIINSLPLDEFIQAELFPFKRAQINKKGEIEGWTVIEHTVNIEFMLEMYGIKHWYDVIQKQTGYSMPEYEINGDHGNSEFYTTVKSLCRLNKVPVDGLTDHLLAIANQNPVNEVVDYLKKLKWDGEEYINRMATELDTEDLRPAEIALRVFFLSACAAADGAEIGMRLNPNARPVYEYILVLLSGQGRGKTKEFRRWLPKALRKYYKESVVLALNEKDSIMQAISNWISEMGELDATFKKSDIAALKAFTSREQDTIRLPYAHTTSRFQRRTQFVASVNDPEFLADRTGNRRYLPLSVDTLYLGWRDEEIDQLWAEAWSRYTNGEQWWPTADEQEVMNDHVQNFESPSSVEQQLEQDFNWERAEDSERRWKGIEILNHLFAPSDPFTTQKSKNYPAAQQKELAQAIKRLWERHGAFHSQGQLVFKQYGSKRRIRAKGKNNGWLMPPLSGEEVNTSETLMKTRLKMAMDKRGWKLVKDGSEDEKE